MFVCLYIMYSSVLLSDIDVFVFAFLQVTCKHRYSQLATYEALGSNQARQLKMKSKTESNTDLSTICNRAVIATAGIDRKWPQVMQLRHS